LRRGKVSPQLPVPGHIPRPSYVGSKGLPELCKGQLHDAQGIAGMRAACKLAARVLDFAGTLVKYLFQFHPSHPLLQMKLTKQFII